MTGGNVYLSSHKQMMDRVKLLTASKNAGNTSNALKKEMWNIVDRLHMDGKISKKKHHAFVKKNII